MLEDELSSWEDNDESFINSIPPPNPLLPKNFICTFEPPKCPFSFIKFL